jgi:transposase
MRSTSNAAGPGTKPRRRNPTHQPLPARPGDGHLARDRRARYALWKNPEDLTDNQRAQLDWIAKTDPRLHRAYLLKEGLRYVFAVKGDAGKHALDRWLSWARRSRMQSFVELARKITKHRAAIDHALDSGLSNGLIESTNTKIRLLTRIAFGFHGPEPLIALALLALGSHPPVLPASGDVIVV